MATVLVVEDERDIREVLRRYLERAGHSVLAAATGAEALGLVATSPDLVLLDLGLPDIDGTDVLAEARAAGVAVIVLTARSDVADRIRGLSLGADDYVTKPFSPQEVVLRVAAVLRRGHTADAERELSLGDGLLRIDPAARTASVAGADVELTPTEWSLLTALAEAPGRVLTRAELVNRARGYTFAGYERTIDSHVKNLRRKLSGAGEDVIVTVTGVGYRMGLRRDD